MSLKRYISETHGWPSTQPGTCTQPCPIVHTAVPPIVHTAVPRENNEHGCVYLRCRAVCKLPGCVEGHPWDCIWLISFQNAHILKTCEIFFFFSNILLSKAVFFFSFYVGPKRDKPLCSPSLSWPSLHDPRGLTNVWPEVSNSLWSSLTHAQTAACQQVSD